MFNFIEEHKRSVIVALLVIFALVSISTSRKLQRRLRWYDKAVLYVTAPFQFVVVNSVNKVVHVLGNYVFLLNIKQDNKFLLSENIRLNQEIEELKEIEIENARLRKLLSFRERLSPTVIPAQVIAKDATAEYRSVRINKGEKHGINVSMSVVNAEGVVGQIVSVANWYSDVLLLTDPNSNIDALIQRTRSRGVVEGKTENLCDMKYLIRTDDVQVGDKVISSGMGGKFPKGLIVGEVVSVSRKNYGVTQQVEVRPRVDFSKIEEVFVVLNKGDISEQNYEDLN